jgi:hypothetical protein
MDIKDHLGDISAEVASAVADYWHVRERQRTRQQESSRIDQGARSAVTGGAQMDGFVTYLSRVIARVGMDERCVFCKRSVDLPGFFRPTKEWDLIVVKDGVLVAAIEAKSQVGPSFGNNFNNRTEEAMGSALDLWTAFREGAFNQGHPPFLGYLFMLEDCPASRRPVRVREPHFKVLPEFSNASFAQRYELFCRKLVLERHYSAASLIMSRQDSGLQGIYSEPAADLCVESFVRQLLAQVLAYVR